MKRPASSELVDTSSSGAPKKRKARGKEKNVVRAEWTEPQRAYLVSLLVEFGREEDRIDNGWGRSAWDKITTKWMEKFPDANYTKCQIKDQEQHLKKKFKALTQLIDSNNELEWNNDVNMVEASRDGAWDDIFKTNKEARQWHNRPFPYYNDLYNLYQGCTNSTRTPPSRNLEGRSNHAIKNGSTSKNEKTKTAVVPVPVRVPVPISPFTEEYFAFRREETSWFINAMKDLKGNKGNEKYGVSVAMKAFKELEGFTFDDYDKATTLFMSSVEFREAFLTFEPHERALWIRKRIDGMLY